MNDNLCYFTARVFKWTVLHVSKVFPYLFITFETGLSRASALEFETFVYFLS